MVGRIIIIACLMSTSVMAQREDYVRPGLITAGMTISPSVMLNRSESNYYLSGHLDGRLDEHLSFRGETFYFIDSNQDDPYFKTAGRTYFGLLYHLNKGNFDSHVGFMPGIALMEVNGNVNSEGRSSLEVVPTFAANIGVTYYVWKFFNFFMNVTYVHSTVRDIRIKSGRTDELLLSAGLGFNINTVKAK